MKRTFLQIHKWHELLLCADCSFFIIWDFLLERKNLKDKKGHCSFKTWWQKEKETSSTQENKRFIEADKTTVMNSWKCGALHSQPDIISSPNAACCKTSLVLACWELSHRHILGRNKKNHWIIAQTGTLLYSFTKTPLLVERSEQWRKGDMAEFSSEGWEKTENDTSWLSLLTKKLIH